MIIRLIGVPFDGLGRRGGQDAAPRVLRGAGLETALAARQVVRGPDLSVPETRAERGPLGFLNEAALVPMLEALRDDLDDALTAAQFPLLYGGDCSVLLAVVPALRSRCGHTALLFVDGHEDATSMERSPDGEAANMEIAMLLGLTGQRLPPPFHDAVGALDPAALAMVGPHDADYRRTLQVESIADRVFFRTIDDVSADPARAAEDAVRRITAGSPDWWLHIDLDVLDGREFSARGAPGEPPLAGGLTWQQLTELTVAALSAGGCRGLSVVIYNPELDPDRSQARRIVRFFNEIAPTLP